jgi:hypothetical protein
VKLITSLISAGDGIGRNSVQTPRHEKKNRCFGVTRNPMQEVLILFDTFQIENPKTTKKNNRRQW